VNRKTLASALSCLGAGLYAAVAFWSINTAAHAEAWGLRTMYVLCGLLAGASAGRLAGSRREASSESGLLLSALLVAGFLLPLAARPEGVTVWAGGPWLGSAGAALALASCLALGPSFGLAPAARGVVSRGPYAVVRHPMATAFLLLGSGYLLTRFSAWNATVMGVTAVMVVVAALCDERVLGRDPEYLDYARRVPRRFVPGMI
jgi:protein-S-isoprenylcysteine O-methyltransferase Ste14